MSSEQIGDPPPLEAPESDLIEPQEEPSSPRLRQRTGMAVYNEDTLAALAMGQEHTKIEPEDEYEAPVEQYSEDEGIPLLPAEETSSPEPEEEGSEVEDPGPVLRRPKKEEKGDKMMFALGVAFMLATVAAVLN